MVIRKRYAFVQYSVSILTAPRRRTPLTGPTHSAIFLVFPTNTYSLFPYRHTRALKALSSLHRERGTHID